MNSWKVARDKGNQIARGLRLRKSSELVHQHNRRLFDKILADMARSPDSPALARLEGLLRQVRPRRELQTAVALLDVAWRIPVATRLQDDVVLMIRRCYLDAPQEEWRLRIRDELRDRQVHPFPSVRRIVHLVRQLDPVDEAEVHELRDLERGYPDLRQSIAERIIIHSQINHLEPVIRYLSNALERKETDPEEKKTTKRVFSQMAKQFQKSDRALEVLYRMYLSKYQGQESHGFLMLALAGYGDAIAPQLVYTHDANPQDRAAIEQVLAQIVARGGVEATRALLSILRDAQAQHAARICKFLSKGLKTLAGYSEKSIGKDLVRKAVAEALPVLERRTLPDIRRFIDNYAALEWGSASVAMLVKRVIAGNAHGADMQQLRRFSRPAARLLVEFAEDTTQEPAERRRALDALASLRAAAHAALGRRLWSIFQEAEAAELADVQAGVLRALSALELDPGRQARAALFDLLQTSASNLHHEIHAAWNHMFPATGLTDDVPRDE